MEKYFMASVEILLEADSETGANEALFEGLGSLLPDFRKVGSKPTGVIDWRTAEPLIEHNGEGFESVDKLADKKTTPTRVIGDTPLEIGHPGCAPSYSTWREFVAQNLDSYAFDQLEAIQCGLEIDGFYQDGGGAEPVFVIRLAAPKPVWTLDDQAEALAEGWGLGRIQEEPGMCVMRNLLAVHFSGDSDAERFVRFRAERGSPLHKKALGFITKR